MFNSALKADLIFFFFPQQVANVIPEPGEPVSNLQQTVFILCNYQISVTLITCMVLYSGGPLPGFTGFSSVLCLSTHHSLFFFILTLGETWRKGREGGSRETRRDGDFNFLLSVFVVAVCLSSSFNPHYSNQSSSGNIQNNPLDVSRDSVCQQHGLWCRVFVQCESSGECL